MLSANERRLLPAQAMPVDDIEEQSISGTRDDAEKAFNLSLREVVDLMIRAELCEPEFQRFLLAGRYLDAFTHFDELSHTLTVQRLTQLSVKSPRRRSWIAISLVALACFISTSPAAATQPRRRAVASVMLLPQAEQSCLAYLSGAASQICLIGGVYDIGVGVNVQGNLAAKRLSTEVLRVNYATPGAKTVVIQGGNVQVDGSVFRVEENRIMYGMFFLSDYHTGEGRFVVEGTGETVPDGNGLSKAVVQFTSATLKIGNTDGDPSKRGGYTLDLDQNGPDAVWWKHEELTPMHFIVYSASGTRAKFTWRAFVVKRGEERAATNLSVPPEAN